MVSEVGAGTRVRAGTVAGTVAATVRELADVLARAGVAEPRAEARDLVAALLDVPRFWPSTHADAPLDDATLARLRAAAARRAQGAPFAYAARRAAFRHLTLDVDERVLIPRQETEVLVDLVLGAGLPPGGVAIDVGTGSGAIALALATEGEFQDVIATDVSRDALDVAEANRAQLDARLRARVTFAHGSLLAPLGPSVRARAIVSNPPYIALEEATQLPASVRDWEPALALFSGAGGMHAIAALVRQAPAHLEPGGLLALEVDSRRASLAAELVMADARYEGVEVRWDLAGRERFVLGRRAATI